MANDSEESPPRPRPRPRRSAATAPKARPVAVVGVGVCARSFNSLERLFADLSPELNAAYVVAVRQRDGLSVDAVVDALKRRGRMAVKVAEDGEALAPNQIFVGASDAMVTVEKGRLCSRSTDEPVGERGTIDTLLISIGETYHDRSVAVVLDGLDSDGTAGVAGTKECGGLAIAELIDGEEPAAEAVTAAGIADLRLSIEQIPGQIALYVRNLAKMEEEGGFEGLKEQAAAQMARITTILRNVTGNDFHGYKQNTFLRRVARRMQVLGVQDIEAYVERLRSEPVEVHHLFQDLLIGVTQFFRDAAEFQVIERQVIPDIFKDKGPEDRVRIWVVGCATGEEAYSLAILLREHMETLDTPPQVQVFATDLDARALAVARAGRYPDTTIQEHVTRERLARWFVREGGTYCVSKALREMCIFSPHNVLKDAPFSRIDLLSCRNLLIYLDAELQNRVIPIFHFALKPGGYLFLGNAENVSRHGKLFSAADRKNRVFRRLDTVSPLLPELPLSPRAQRVEGLNMPATRRRSATPNAARRAEMVAERFAPAYVVVDRDGEVQHFSGRTGRYLEPSAGAATLNILNLVHRELRLDLRTALSKAATLRERVETPRVQLPIDGQATHVNLMVEPLGSEEPLNFIVLFNDAGPAPAFLAEGADHGLVSDEHLRRVESELRVTKERLQATIEELESTNEELKSSNEEYQSINEELQSANEELETSKEELQSVNEELQTLNHELATRVSELGRSNSDLKNLLESTQIATIFLDNEQRVRSFTPAATEVFHLLDTDTGRPISHIASRIGYPELLDDVRSVLRNLAPVEREVTGEGDRRFIVRVLPYRSLDNYIAGAVVTFTDISAAARAESQLADSERRLSLIVEQARDYAIFGTDAEGRIENWLPGAQAVLGWAPEEIIGQPLEITYTPEDRAAGVPQQEFERARDEGYSPNIRWHIRKDGSRVFIDGSAHGDRSPDGEFRGVFKIGRDTTERMRSEQHQRMLVAELQHRTRNILGVIRSIARRTALNSDTAEDYARHLDGRISALARVQGILTRRPGEGVDLTTLLQDELTAHGADGERVQVDGPPVSLRNKAAENMAMAVHELATNAVKHGALGNGDAARLAVRWSVTDGADSPHLRFEWRETGVPVLNSAPRRRGFGSELIEKLLPYELKAVTSLELEPGGVRCTIDMPLDDAGPGFTGQLPEAPQ